MADPYPAEVLNSGATVDNYRIDSVLGVGGFGVTYKAFDQQLERTVAVKEYFPSGLAYRAEDGTTLRARTASGEEHYEYGLNRFLDEARTLAKFQHPSIVRVSRFIETNGTAYLVMDFEEGETLEATIIRVGRVDAHQVFALAVHILRGLGAVHDKQYLHRDIKPANVLARHHGPPVLLDFGAARLALEQRAQAMTIMLTPGYAPIEQFSSDQPQGPYTDIYALGATLFHCIVGKVPAPATRRALVSHLGEPDPVSVELEALRSQLPKPLLETMAWMLKTGPSERPQSVHEVIEFILSEGATPRTATTVRATEVEPQTPASERTTQFSAPPPSATPPPQPQATVNLYTRSQGRPIPTAPPPELPPALVGAATSALADVLGPIASVLVQRAQSTTGSPDELLQQLAEGLDDDDERRAFWDAMKPYLRS